MKLKNLNTESINKYGFIVIIQLFFLLILYKVFNVPITHDETATTVHYCEYYNMWQIMMYPDSCPNNHILNTLFTKVMLYLFNPDQWVVRLPNLLSFLIYGWGIYRIVSTSLTRKSLLFLPAVLMFLANPYLTDFFGLCRGYGMSTAIATLSVSYLLSAYMRKANKHIWWAFGLSILASYANFSLLVFFCATVILVFFYFFIQYKVHRKKLLLPIIYVTVICLVYFAFIANPIIKMQSTDQFQFWESTGFYHATIYYSVYAAFFETPWANDTLISIIAKFAFILTVFYTVFIIYKFFKSRFKTEVFLSPFFAATFILVLTSSVSFMQSVLIQTPNLIGRTAIFFYPLFMSMVVASLAFIEKKKAYRTAAILSFLIVILSVTNIIGKTRLKSVWEWEDDSNNYEVIDYLKVAHGGSQVSLKSNWIFHPSFYFYQFSGKTPFILLEDYDKNIDPETDADYYYVFAEDYEQLKDKFFILYKFSPERWLLKTNRALENKFYYSEETKKILVTRYVEDIKSSKEWMEIIREKAIQRNIPVDSMLYIDAVWMIENK